MQDASQVSLGWARREPVTGLFPRLSLCPAVWGFPTCLAETLSRPSEAIPAPLRLCVQASVNQDMREGRLCWGRVMNLTCLGASPAPQSLSLE
jgi:hypothetical protein